DLFQYHACLAHIAFKPAFSQVFLKCPADLLLMGRNSVVKSAESGETCAHRKCGSALKIAPLSGDKVFDFLFCHVQSLLSRQQSLWKIQRFSHRVYGGRSFSLAEILYFLSFCLFISK